MHFVLLTLRDNLLQAICVYLYIVLLYYIWFLQWNIYITVSFCQCLFVSWLFSYVPSSVNYFRSTFLKITSYSLFHFHPYPFIFLLLSKSYTYTHVLFFPSFFYLLIFPVIPFSINPFTTYYNYCPYSRWPPWHLKAKHKVYLSPLTLTSILYFSSK